MAVTGENTENQEMRMVVKELVVDGEPFTAIPATQISVAGFTTAGSTVIAAGTLQEVLEAIADLADPLV